MSSNRVDRGRDTELITAKRLRYIWPKAEASPRSVRGRDIRNTPPYAIECKARSRFSPLEWARQAKRNAGDEIPVVIMRPNGLGPESFGRWLAFMYVEDWLSEVQLAQLGRSLKSTGRTSTETTSNTPQRSIGVRLESRADNSSDEAVQAGLRALLSQMDIGPGNWEVQIFRGTSSGRAA